MLFADDATLTVQSDKQMQQHVDKFQRPIRNLFWLSVWKRPRLMVHHQQLQTRGGPSIHLSWPTITDDLSFRSTGKLDTYSHRLPGSQRGLGKTKELAANMKLLSIRHVSLVCHFMAVRHRVSTQESISTFSTPLIWDASWISSRLTTSPTQKFKTPSILSLLLQQFCLCWFDQVHHMPDRRIPKDLYGELATGTGPRRQSHHHFKDMKSLDLDILRWQEGWRWRQILWEGKKRVEEKQELTIKEKRTRQKEKPTVLAESSFKFSCYMYDCLFLCSHNGCCTTSISSWHDFFGCRSMLSPNWWMTTTTI